jgi:hypothetical protein
MALQEKFRPLSDDTLFNGIRTSQSGATENQRLATALIEFSKRSHLFTLGW